jgi:hypothetical protein
MDPITLKAFMDGGIAVGLSVALISILYLVVKHVLKSQDRILDMATTQNEGWQRAITDHTAQAKQFHDSVTEAHKYQREEHKENSNILTSLCGLLNASAESTKSFRTYVTDNLDIRRREQEKILTALENVVVNLKEVTVTLGRINGYTHEGPKGDKGDKGDRGNHG